MSRQVGRTITYDNVPAQTHLSILTSAGLPQPFAEILVDLDAAIERGPPAATPGDLARLTGRPTTPLADTVAAALSAAHS